MGILWRSAVLILSYVLIDILLGQWMNFYWKDKKDQVSITVCS